MNVNIPKYTWPDLSPVERQFMVRDEQGRYGVGIIDPVYHGEDTIFARPVGVPGGGSVMTAWDRQPDGTYTGFWFDAPPGKVQPGELRRLKIVEDLGWVFPDKWVDRVLAGSTEPGHWDCKVGGESPIRGQQHDETGITGAVEYTREVGQPLSESAIRKAAQRGDIPGARKIGRNWLIPYDGLNHLLDNPPRRGPRRRKSSQG